MHSARARSNHGTGATQANAHQSTGGNARQSSTEPSSARANVERYAGARLGAALSGVRVCFALFADRTVHPCLALTFVVAQE